MSMLPRGIRNNNPGNIDRRDGTKWQGMAADQSGDMRFVVFNSPESGIRALARVLLTYFDKHGLTTVRQIISRWAPSVENNTDAYIAEVCKAIGVGSRDPLDLHAYAHMKPLVEAIIRHENGNPAQYGRGTRWYSQAVVDEGLHRAGILPKPSTVAKRAATSPEVVGTTTASSGLPVALIAEQLQQGASQVQVANSGPSPSTILNWVAIVLVIVGIAITIYGVIRKNRGNAA